MPDAEGWRQELSRGHALRRLVAGTPEDLWEEQRAAPGGRWADTGEPRAVGEERRGCGHCGLPDAPGGEDRCLGHIEDPEVEFACCSHGDSREALVYFRDRSCRRGGVALAWFRERGVGPDRG